VADLDLDAIETKLFDALAGTPNTDKVPLVHALVSELRRRRKEAEIDLRMIHGWIAKADHLERRLRALRRDLGDDPCSVTANALDADTARARRFRKKQAVRR
jgi:hypothetical protein